MRVGVLTGGGDCPGLNAVIRAIVRTAWHRHGDEVLGARDGWRGVVEGHWMPLDVAATRGLIHRCGTILGSSRSDPAWFGEQPGDVAARLAEQRLDGLIAIGGDGTLRVAANLARAGLPVLGVPKTIDNDIGGTDMTFGFDTAVQIASDAIRTASTPPPRATRLGVAAAEAAHARRWGTMPGLRGGRIELTGLADAITHPRHVADAVLGVARPANPIAPEGTSHG